MKIPHKYAELTSYNTVWSLSILLSIFYIPFLYLWLFLIVLSAKSQTGHTGLDWPCWLAGYLKRIAELNNFTMFHYYSIRMILNTNKEFIQSEVVVCKKEYWDLKVKLLPLCLHSVGIPKIRLVKLKSDNLQYNTLGRWVAWTNNSSTKWLMFQVPYFRE